uniref:Candidate secreted effector n=1 Tax=Meloidogyne incognita TaxID=6306 RepID=A0A914MJS4_MELIC
MMWETRRIKRKSMKVNNLTLNLLPLKRQTILNFSMVEMMSLVILLMTMTMKILMPSNIMLMIIQMRMALMNLKMNLQARTDILIIMAMSSQNIEIMHMNSAATKRILIRQLKEMFFST